MINKENTGVVVIFYFYAITEYRLLFIALYMRKVTDGESRTIEEKLFRLCAHDLHSVSTPSRRAAFLSRLQVSWHVFSAASGTRTSLRLSS